MSTDKDARPASGAWIELPDGGRVDLVDACRIGRIEGNEIVNQDQRTSRWHAVVQRNGTQFVLVDLGSTNGTFINDTRVFKPTFLQDGDTILVGTSRYTLHLPPESVAGGPVVEPHGTMAAVERAHCWMLIVAPPRSPSAEAASWVDQVRRMLELGGAGLRILPNATCFAHWREGTVAPEKIRTLVLALAALPPPAGAALVLHYGAARVGLAAVTGEESLLGPDVTFAHKLQSAATDRGIPFVLTGPAVESLTLDSCVSPLGASALSGVPETHALFLVEPPA